MAAGGEEVQIGPFVGGLDTFADPSAIADNELVVCDNFEPDIDGSLKSRPPIVDIGASMPLGAVGDLHLLGYFNNIDNTQYLLGTDGVSKTYYFNGAAWILITSTYAASAMAQFDNKAWLPAPAGSPNPGGYWSPATSFVPDANMPKGDVIVAHKLRLWMAVGGTASANGTRLYSSNVLGSAPFWPVSPNFIDIGGGDGQNIVQVVVYYSSLLIFRNASIFIFEFASDPAQGTVRLSVPNVGLTDKNAVAMFESQIFFLFDDKAYQFQNGRAQQINQKVPFTSGSTVGVYQPYAVSIFNRRIIFSYWANTYIYYIQNGTWATWSSTVWGPLGRLLSVPPTVGPSEAITHSSRSVVGATRAAHTLRIVDDITSNREVFQCTVQTKNYNYQASNIYKRLFSGGIDGIFRGKIVADAVPIVYVKKLTWGQIRANGITWGRFLSKTWGTLSSDKLTITSVVDADATSAQRKYVKLWRSLYFRQIYYRCVFECDGSVDTAPVRLFAFLTTVTAKEPVSRTVT